MRNAQKPRKHPTQSRAKATWQIILKAAAQVLLRRGYEKATTDRIAERAGVSVGSVYEYFPNKEAIYAALILNWNAERWEIFQQILGDAQDLDLDEGIRRTVRARIAATRLNPKLNTVLLQEVPGNVTADQARAP